MNRLKLDVNAQSFTPKYYLKTKEINIIKNLSLSQSSEKNIEEVNNTENHRGNENNMNCLIKLNQKEEKEKDQIQSYFKNYLLFRFYS
jgi:hypothetical protein